MAFYGWRPYVPVADRRRKALREMEKRQKQGQAVSPVSIEGRTIATTFWGKAWCENLERYSDYENRLPRGRSYVCNGLVVDLQITPGKIQALVSGSHLYKVALKVAPVAKAQWKSICNDCGGAIDSLVELLQGRLSTGVMERICRPQTGLFPSPKEIKFNCSCPDWAAMCKHVAAVLYGVGARLDEQPELLFTLRKVDAKDLVARAGAGLPLARKAPAAGKMLDASELAEVFGIEMADALVPDLGAKAAPVKKKVPVKKSAPARKKKAAKRKAATGAPKRVAAAPRRKSG